MVHQIKPQRTAAIIVAAGKGERAKQDVPKQFAIWRGKPVVRHSAETFDEVGCNPIIVVIPKGSKKMAAQILAGMSGIELIDGGATRQESVYAGLKVLESYDIDTVLIHDAARPQVVLPVLDRLNEALRTYAGAIPVLPVVDSLAIEKDGTMAGSADRKTLRRVQTPQAFRFDAIMAAHRNWHGAEHAGDDAQVLHAAGGRVAHVKGDEAMQKLTFPEDFPEGSDGSNLPVTRTGIGYDVHRLVEGEDLWLAGIQLDHEKGLAGHSDADVALHAIVDALLGAAAAGDIGDHFPPSDERWRGAASSEFVRHASSIVSQAGYEVGNIDLTIICEAPRIGPHRDRMRDNIAGLLSISKDCVNVKVTTTERLGFTGRQEGIAAQAIATISRRI